MSTSDWMNSPEMQRAALIDIASNPAQPVADRLAIALQVIAELETALAAARREGWAQAIEALRDREAWLEWWRTHPLASFDEYLNSRAADYLTDRAAALTEEGGQ